MSKIDIVSFWNQSGSIGMAPYVNTSADGGHIDYEGVYSKVDLNTRMQTIVSALPDFFESYRIVLTDVNLSGVLVSKAECVLKASSSSDVPDYTDILTSINTNLTNLNGKFVSSNNNVAFILESIFFSLNSGNLSDSAANKKIRSYVRYLQSLNASYQNESEENFHNYSYFRALHALFDGGQLPNPSDIRNNSFIKAISDLLKQSVSPNASITDVISSLNATIDSKQETTIVNNDNTNLVQVEGVLDYRLKPQDTM